MLTQHNTNNPQDVFNTLLLMRKLVLSSFWQHMIYSKLQTVSSVSPKGSFFIAISKSALHIHTSRTCRICLVDTPLVYLCVRLPLLLMLLLECIHCRLYKCVCWSFCIHIAGDAVHPLSLTPSLLFPGSQTLALGFNGTYFLGPAETGCIFSLLAW